MNALTPTVRPASLRRALTAALCLLAGLGALFASAASAKSRAASVKPTIVLVHGAWADGSSWNRVVPRLQHAGYTVDVEANPLRGLASDSAYLAAVLHSITGPIILVGHSYGGAVITDAATGNTNVKGLVYIDAFVPAAGESVLQLASAQPGSCIGGGTSGRGLPGGLSCGGSVGCPGLIGGSSCGSIGILRFRIFQLGSSTARRRQGSPSEWTAARHSGAFTRPRIARCTSRRWNR